MEIEIRFNITESEMDKFAADVDENTAGHLSPEDVLEVVAKKTFKELLKSEPQNVRVTISL